jgi:hypothetical protein
VRGSALVLVAAQGDHTAIERQLRFICRAPFGAIERSFRFAKAFEMKERDGPMKLQLAELTTRESTGLESAIEIRERFGILALVDTASPADEKRSRRQAIDPTQPIDRLNAAPPLDVLHRSGQCIFDRARMNGAAA